MKKILLLCSVVFVAFSFAKDDFRFNLINSLKNLIPNANKIEILSTDKLSSIPNLNFTICKIEDENIAFFATNDGKNIIGFSNLVAINSQKDKNLINTKLENLQNQIKLYQEKIVYEILKTIPDDRFITINSFDKNNKFLTYMISDPECPHCRAEISKMVKWLRNANVKIIFAPVHGKSAYTKSSIMLKEAKKIDPNNQEAMIKLLEKYYDKNAQVSDNMASDEERNAVLKDAKKIFSKGVVKGVPFSFTIQK
ncbi:hypothetical protein F1B92_05100 [Campylobacter sp. FMV-PI01]|uniref:Disulfide isomerase DsbG N-terminal domain-containing protein n=1 Tax=Campylobacter portucalensis TaxID=2608384 RepID=A0A6L5WHI7_9BACT|nr:hypothetical protein [Campylobacter portucalensis]MSN96549.1 hypothetical protein [Campylobacter portucalensis]